MDLMEVRNNRAFPTVHALMMEPFKTIWESDETPTKEHAMKIFSYTELMCSPKKSNNFYLYKPEVRVKKVLKEIYKDEDKPITEWMILCVDRYKEELAKSSPTYELLEAGMRAKDDLVEELGSINYKERTKSGGLVTKHKDVADALARIPGITRELITNREKVGSELEDAAKTRNQREVGLFER